MSHRSRRRWCRSSGGLPLALAVLLGSLLAPPPSRAGAAPAEALVAAAGDALRPEHLAPGARVVGSFFSPLIGATVTRIVGPAELGWRGLVAGLPERARLVPNARYRPAAAAVRDAPDPYRSFQYALDVTGVERARSVADGRGAVVALLDSAPQADHRDLGALRVLDLADGREPPVAALHGSLMAGVVGAVEGNGFGIAGVAPGARLLAVPVCRGDAYGTPDACDLFDVLAGADLARERGAQILNVSLVGPPNPLLTYAVERLEAQGVLVVAAAGNEGSSEPRFPAAYASVIGVGAVDREGSPYARGNRGVSVDVLAPGVEILSTAPGDRFAFGDGTSLAAAHVTGLLALGLSAGGDPKDVRRAFFAAARARATAGAVGAVATERALPIPTACALLAELGHPCPEERPDEEPGAGPPAGSSG